MVKRVRYRNPGTAYIKLHPLIINVCTRFAQKYGGNIDDYLSESSTHFMEIWRTNDPDVCPLDGDIVYRLWKKLLQTKRTEQRRLKRLPRVALDAAVEEQACSYTTPEFDLVDFAERLPVDAEELVWLLFGSVPDIEFAVACRGEPSPKNIRQALKEFLKDCGWSFTRIAQSFRDVKEAIS